MRGSSGCKSSSNPSHALRNCIALKEELLRHSLAWSRRAHGPQFAGNRGNRIQRNQRRLTTRANVPFSSVASSPLWMIPSCQHSAWLSVDEYPIPYRIVPHTHQWQGCELASGQAVHAALLRQVQVLPCLVSLFHICVRAVRLEHG